MSLYVYHQTKFVPVRSHIDSAFASDSATRELVLALTADIEKLLSDDTLRLRLPAVRHPKELQLVWGIDGEYPGAIALIDETLGKSEPPLAAAKAVRLKEVKRLTEIAQHFMREYAPQDVAPQIGVSGAPSTQPAKPGTLVTKVFTLTNLSDQGGSFALAAAQITGPAGAIKPAGYVVLAASQQIYPSVDRLPELHVAAGDSVEVGVTYEVPDADAGQRVFCLLAAHVSVRGQRSQPQTALVWDIVTPTPSATATQPVQQTVAPATTCTDAFALTNTSGQSATFSFAVDLQLTDAKGKLIQDVPARHFAAFSATLQSDSTQSAAATNLSDFNAQLARLPVAHDDSLAVTLSYKVPDGAKGDLLIDTVAVSAIAGNSASTPVQTVTATNVLGSAIDVLSQIVVELNETYHLTTLPASVPARLLQLNEEILDFVNDGAQIAPTTHDFAHALAVHDLVDALYGRLIGDDRPAPRIDVVP